MKPCLFVFSSKTITRTFSGLVTGYYQVCNLFYDTEENTTTINCQYDADYPSSGVSWFLTCYYIIASVLPVAAIIVDIYQGHKQIIERHQSVSDESDSLNQELLPATTPADAGASSREGALILSASGSGSDSSIVNMEYSNSDDESVNSNSRLLVAPA